MKHGHTSHGLVALKRSTGLLLAGVLLGLLLLVTNPDLSTQLGLERRVSCAVSADYAALMAAKERGIGQITVSQRNADIMQMDVAQMAHEIERLRAEVERVRSMGMRSAAELKDALQEIKSLRARGGAKCTKDGTDLSQVGYGCEAGKEDMERYLDYKPREVCPNDWYFVQRLIYKKKCYALPRRRCRVPTAAKPTEPLPVPDALFDQRALKNENVRWDLHQCKSFECLNARSEGDCRLCFNLTMESHRWKKEYRGAIPMARVIEMKKGSLRVGLDVGGGTGSFAAHMATFGVTVMTTAFNVETVYGKKAGLPYLETIAARGLVGLWSPHASRLPFFNGALDVIHSVNSIKYLETVEFEELLYEWDRVLRVGGIFWFEMFYAHVDEMPKYVDMIQQLGYKKLYWNFTPKTDRGEREGPHVYLNCVLEKQAVLGGEVLDGPSAEDMQDIV